MTLHKTFATCAECDGSSTIGYYSSDPPGRPIPCPQCFGTGQVEIVINYDAAAITFATFLDRNVNDTIDRQAAYEILDAALGFSGIDTEICFCTLDEVLDGHRCFCPEHTPTSKCSWKHDKGKQENLTCDFCHVPMSPDETGIYLTDLQKGGHISCARKVLDTLDKADEL